jgi:hypothetical protein
MNYFSFIGRAPGADLAADDAIVMIGLRVTHAASLIYWKILSTVPHNDFITLGGKFPRLIKKEAKARLKEIKGLLLAI